MKKTLKNFILILNKMVEIQYDIFLQRKEEKSSKREKKDYTLRNLKFSSNKICWSTGIKFILAESFNKI